MKCIDNPESVSTEAQPTKVAGTLRRAVRGWISTVIPGERHMECAYYLYFCRLYLQSDYR